MYFALSAVVSLALASTGHAAAWSKALDISGFGYFDHFGLETIADPTHGRT
jgi:hypothetical protein